MTAEDEPGEPERGETAPGPGPARAPRVPGPRGDGTGGRDPGDRDAGGRDPGDRDPGGRDGDAARSTTPPPDAAPGPDGTPGAAEPAGSPDAPPDAATERADAAGPADPPPGPPRAGSGGGRPVVPGPRGGEHESTAGTDVTATAGTTRGTGGGGVPAGREGDGEGTGDLPTQRSTPDGPAFGHGRLMSLLGAWALSACSPAEATAVDRHLTGCPGCAEEALRLQDAVALLEPQRTLDLDPALRPDVLAGCLRRRPARLPIPDWAVPYEGETARLDSLLNDMVAEEWSTPVRLKWFSGDSPVGRTTTVAGVLDHLIALDGLLCPVLGLPDPLGEDAAGGGPAERTELHWRRTEARREAEPEEVRGTWRELTRALVRAAGEAAADAGREVAYRTPEGFGGGVLSLRDAFLDRAFACWVHAEDIARAVAYPYDPPPGPQLRMLIDLAARRLPVSLADRRRAGLAGSPGRLAPAGEPGRTLHLEVEGDGGGHWYIPLDSPTAVASRENAVAHVALEDTAFCKLAAGRLTPAEAAAGGDGDPRAIQDMLFATAALSRI